MPSRPPPPRSASSGDGAAVFVAGRVVDVRMAAQAVAEGATDVVAMTRAHLADPHLVRKAREGRVSETTRCVGANVCVERALRGSEVAYVVNPVTGREERWGAGSLDPGRPSHANRRRRRRSRRASGRGDGRRPRPRRDPMLERERDAGGHLRDLAWLPTRESWYRAIEDLVSTIERHGGRIETGASTELDELLALPADTLVVATGATWDETGASAHRPDRVGDPPDVERRPGPRARRSAGPCTARSRACSDGGSSSSRRPAGTRRWGSPRCSPGRARRVHVVTPGPTMGAEAAAELELPHVMPRLRELGVELTVWHGVDAIDGRRVVLDDVWGGEPSVVDEVDAIVLASASGRRRTTSLRACMPQAGTRGWSVMHVHPARRSRSSTRRKSSHEGCSHPLRNVRRRVAPS